MTERPLFTSIDLWENHRDRCLALLREAMLSLDSSPSQESEPEINRRLYRAILATQQAAAKRGEEPLSVVIYEGRNPPAASDPEFDPREYKIPDFQWAYIDHLTPDPTAAAPHFVIECKRLAASTSSRDFFEQYVAGGVQRFISVEHAYGKNTPSGAMIGYLQAVDLDPALAQVNAHTGAAGIPSLELRRAAQDLAELDHALERTFADSPFTLLHFWISITP